MRCFHISIYNKSFITKWQILFIQLSDEFQWYLKATVTHLRKRGPHVDFISGVRKRAITTTARPIQWSFLIHVRSQILTNYLSSNVCEKGWFISSDPDKMWAKCSSTQIAMGGMRFPPTSGGRTTKMIVINRNAHEVTMNRIDNMRDDQEKVWISDESTLVSLHHNFGLDKLTVAIMFLLSAPPISTLFMYTSRL